MAGRFAIQINDLRFLVNPTGLNVQKGLSFGPINTQAGVRYQVWYATPEVVTITGESAGSTAYTELNFLKRNFERADKLSELFYKTRLYKGFITNIAFDHNILNHPNRFSYSITFQLLQGEEFAVEDFSLTREEQGIAGRAVQAVEQFINKQINIDKIQSKIDNFYNKF